MSTPMESYGAAYREARRQIGELARALPDEELARAVPATPEWSVKDLIAHVSGIAADIVTGNVGDAGSPEWTAAQIEAAREVSLEELLAGWEKSCAQVEPLLDTLHPTAAALTVGDLVVHEHDLRGAIGNRDARDTERLTLALAAYVRRFGKRVKDAGLRTIRVVAGDGEWNAGLDTPAIDLRDDPFELFRAITGRRTKDEIRKLGWTGDPEPYVDIVSAYGHPTESLGE
jgi:uncharacterized protein (TIGR03083 family)